MFLSLLTLNDVAIERTDVCKYLGVRIDKAENYEAEIENIIDKTTKLFYALNNSFLQKGEAFRSTKVYKMMYKHVFESDSWVLIKYLGRKIQVAGIIYLHLQLKAQQ